MALWHIRRIISNLEILPAHGRAEIYIGPARYPYTQQLAEAQEIQFASEGNDPFDMLMMIAKLKIHLESMERDIRSQMAEADKGKTTIGIA